MSGKTEKLEHCSILQIYIYSPFIDSVTNKSESQYFHLGIVTRVPLNIHIYATHPLLNKLPFDLFPHKKKVYGSQPLIFIEKFHQSAIMNEDNIDKTSPDQELISLEESRLSGILQTIKDYQIHRRQQFAKHRLQIDELKKERLNSQNWPEKNRLTEKIRDKEAYNPAKYLPEFDQTHSPYFASCSIEDDNPKIGKQTFLIGKQSLFKDNKVVIIDWRQASISTLYYEYEPGEDYDEEINGRERTGLLTQKTKYTIKASELVRIEHSEGTVLKKTANKWHQAGKGNTTSQQKEDAGDHHLVDIVSLISPEQFQLITKGYHGCLRLQGSAGAGKTTIALHRLSYLIFNYPEKFRPERCLVLMFNRALRNYVAATVKEMIGPQTPVETFHSWAARSLRALGLKKISFTANCPQEFDRIKKSSGMAKLVREYAATAKDALPTKHLFSLYSSSRLAEKFLADDTPPALLKKFIEYYSRKLAEPQQTNEIAFADVGVFLRLFQIRVGLRGDTENLAYNYFDHMVIDEAQDFSQVELECLFHATSKERSLTICADPNQQILNFVDSTGLENFQLDLQASGVSAEKLEVSYRSTMEIMEVANTVLGNVNTDGKRHGEPVYFGKHLNIDDALLDLERLVRLEQEKSPNGLIAVICKQKNQVNQIYGKLRIIPGTRKDPQNFQAGILVINVHQVKGLEFTSVIAWDVSSQSYRANSPNDRNLLYVCLSRACDRLAVFSHTTPSPYLNNFF